MECQGCNQTFTALYYRELDGTYTCAMCYYEQYGDRDPVSMGFKWTELECD